MTAALSRMLKLLSPEITDAVSEELSSIRACRFFSPFTLTVVWRLKPCFAESRDILLEVEKRENLDALEYRVPMEKVSMPEVLLEALLVGSDHMLPAADIFEDCLDPTDGTFEPSRSAWTSASAISGKQQ
mmetsp:Transcript_10914/g.29724  ORF Transcript_10914/g.29724 Transcript_10914/m.29724 type:complete len:130 (+) Transcript_10914:313-702(+)